MEHKVIMSQLALLNSESEVERSVSGKMGEK